MSSLQELSSKLNAALQERFGDFAWVDEVFYLKNEMVFSRGDRGHKLFAIKYNFNDDGSVQLGDPTEVEKKTTYVPPGSKDASTSTIMLPEDKL
jgi:hypothetical protein